MKAFTRVIYNRCYDSDLLKWYYRKVREYIITDDYYIQNLNKKKRKKFTEAPGTLYDWYERIRDHTGEYYPAINHIYKWEEENEID